MVGEDVEVVTVLGHAAQHALKLADRAVDAAQRQDGPPAAGAKRVRRDVVVEVVHVHGRNPGIEVAGDRQREEAAHPYRKADLDGQPTPAPACLGRMHEEPRHGTSQLETSPQQALGTDPAQHHKGRERREHARARWPREAREAEQVVLGTAREHTAISAAALDNAAPARRLSGFDQGGVARPGKVDVGAPLAVVIVKARDVGAHAVHRRHLEGRRRGRQADRHRLQAVAAMPQHSLEEGHASGRQRPLQDHVR